MAAPHVTAQTLRFCDTDRLGHVNNAVYAVLYEAGRVDLFQSLGLLSGPLVVVIARLEIDFLREMEWPGEVRIETAVARIGAKSLHLRQHLSVAGTLASRGRSVLATIDPTTRRAAPIDAGWRAALAPFLVEDDPAA